MRVDRVQELGREVVIRLISGYDCESVPRLAACLSALGLLAHFIAERRDSAQGGPVEVRVESRHLDEVLVLAPEVFQDDRGFFMEVFRADQFGKLGLPTSFVQANHSRSQRNVLRGMHFQWGPPMGKLMRVTRGSAFLVAVDIRKDSPTLGQWVGVEVSEENKKQVWAPAGFARGFCALSEWTDIEYLCTGIYNSSGESGILWNDSRLNITWPISETEALLSQRDRNAQALDTWLKSPESDFFRL